MISIVLHGRITRDIDSRTTSTGMPSCSFGVVSNERVKRDGALIDVPTFIDCKAYGKTAEFVTAHFSKGKPVIVCGRLTTETWQAKDGSGERSKLACIVDNVHFELSKQTDHAPTPSAKPSRPNVGLEADSTECPF